MNKESVFCYEIKGEKFKIITGAFGSGEHETTLGCVKFIESLDLKGKTFLDIGCGTGILSVAALKCGARYAVAFDISYKACETCRVNAKLNDIDNIYVVCGDNRCIDSDFDVIVANIYVEIILGLVDFNKKSLKKEGYLILSGIPIEEAYTVKSRYIDAGFIFEKAKYHEDFVTMQFQKL
jgi:ribosomal protein L11 methyltransferase